MDRQPSAIIVLPHLRVQNANAISGPLSWGFPSPTAFAGFVHALHRKLGTVALPTDDLEETEHLGLDGVGIVCHSFEPQVYKASYRLRFSLTKNPVDDRKKIGAEGELGGASIIEEGRAHLDLSLLVGVKGTLDQEDGDKLARRVAAATQGMRLAGGSVMPARDAREMRPWYHKLSGYSDEDRQMFRRWRRRLLPGFALIDRHDLLLDHHAARSNADQSTDLLDTMLDLCALHHSPEAQEEGQVVWRASRRKPGWLVPVPVGYTAISPLYQQAEVANTRDPTCPFSFCESIYSMGEWISPHRVDQVQDLLWFHEDLHEQGLYLTVNRNHSAGNGAK